MTLAIRLTGPIIAAVVSLASLSTFVTTVWGHGRNSEVRLLGQRVGAYDVTVMTTPKQPSVGRLHVEVQLMDRRTLTYVDRATVTAIARFGGRQTVQIGPVHSRYREPWHEMDLTVTKSGPWDVNLAIDGPLGREEISFRVDVWPKNNAAARLIRVPEIGDFVLILETQSPRAPVRKLRQERRY